MSNHHKKTSQVWKYYADAGDKRKLCKICNKTLSTKGGGLYNLSRHVRTKHPIEARNLKLRSNRSFNMNNTVEHDYLGNQFEEIAIEVESTSDTQPIPAGEHSILIKPVATAELIDIKTNVKEIKCSPRLMSSNSLHEKHTKDVYKGFIKMMVKNYLPFSITEDASFRAFLNQLSPGYQVPNKVSTNELLNNFYNIEVQEIKLKLKEARCTSLSIDSWTSVYEESYISMVAHFLTNNTEMHSCLLECLKLNENITSEQMAAHLSQIADKWDILDRVLSITSVDTDVFQECVAYHDWRHISCYASTLNACMQKALEEIKDIRGKVQNIAKIFILNAQASESLDQMQLHMGQQIQKIKLDVDSNWISIYAMFQRIIDIKESVMMTIASEFPEVDNLDNNDIAILQKSCEILRIFKLATETLCTGKTMLISEVIPLSNLLLQRTKRFLINNELPTTLQKMVNVLIIQLSEQFTNFADDELFATATLLDPRFKNYGFPEKEPCILEKAKVALYSLASSTITEDIELEDKIEIDPDDIWAEFDTKVSESIKVQKPESSSITEVDKYLEEPILSRQKNPFAWWEENKSIYPHLYEIMRQRLCIPATSMPPEKIFSKIGHDSMEKRNHLPPTKVQKMVFLNFNL